ncbi:MAG: hypothetical protein ACREOV_04035, partial [Candidatus Dormibacteraceae bacterium]
VDLSERYRVRLQRWQPRFWLKARNSRTYHARYLSHLVTNGGDVMALVRRAPVGDGIDGFIVGTLADPPPVYAAGLTCTVDDFCLATDLDWPTTGRALLEEMRAQAACRGATQIVVVCPRRHLAKRRTLRRLGLSLASEWYTAPLEPIEGRRKL